MKSRILVSGGVAVLMLLPYHGVLRSLIDEVFHRGAIRCDLNQGDIYPLGAALELYRLNTGSFPTTGEGLQALITCPASSVDSHMWKQILSRMPIDPWGRPYRYESSGNGQAAIARVYSTGCDPLDPGDDVELRLAAEPVRDEGQ